MIAVGGRGVGHAVCSSCRDKLEPQPVSHHRAHVDSIRVPCPYAPHGCVVTPAYHGREPGNAIVGACPHAPCHCPDGETCGSAAVLLDHSTEAHNWPCTTKVRADETFSIRIYDGFNFLLADDRTPPFWR
jgi:E3 ubiquitin-protein ligase SIAH1